MNLMDFNQIKAAALGRWPEIHAALGIPHHLLDTRKHQPCPHCGGRDRYRYTDYQHGGGFICNQCTPQGGSGLDLIVLVLGLNLKESATQVARVLGMEAQGRPAQRYTPRTAKPSTAATQYDQQGKLADRLAKARRIGAGGAVNGYLNGRGLPSIGCLADILETRAEYWTNPTDKDSRPIYIGTFSAMLAAIRTPDGQLQGLHTTYLIHNEQTGWQKLQATHPQTGHLLPAKKMQSRYSGSLKGAAVHIGQPDGQGRLLVAEGIETALAAQEMFNLPAVAALSAHGMAALQWPPETKELFICADNDTSRTGIKAAHDLAVRAIKQGMAAHIWQPDIIGFDALDEYNRRKEFAK